MARTRNPLILLGVLFALAIGGIRSGIAQDAVPQLPPEYRTLASSLGQQIEPTREAFPDPEEVDLADLIADVDRIVLELQEIQSDDRQITYLARQAEAVVTELAKRIHRIEAMPVPSMGNLFMASFACGFLGDPVVGPTLLGANAMKQYDDLLAEVRRTIPLLNRADGLHRLLPQIARKYSPATTETSDRIAVDFDEAWGPVGPHDWLILTNSGADLTDCTILVELTGASGQVRQNVHFAEYWAADTPMYARYEMGGLFFEGKHIGSTTVLDVKSITVTVWSPEESFRIEYMYQGEEKDRDIAQHLKGLSMKGSFRPLDEGWLWNTYPAAVFTMDGVQSLPACQVTVTFNRGRGKLLGLFAQSRSWDWELDGWRRGQRQTFQPPRGELTFVPDEIVLEVTFPGTSYTHRTTVAVAND